MVVETERAEIEARARVTERMRPLRVDGQQVHQVALPWHWGFGMLSPGDSANDLGMIVATRTSRSRRTRRSPATSGPVAARRETTEKLKGVHVASRTDPSHDASSEGHRDVMTEIAIQRDGRPADGLLHRHDGVHRLQGVRGRLQAVERPALRRRHVPQGRLVRPHRAAVGQHVASRALRRARRRGRRRQRGGDPGSGRVGGGEGRRRRSDRRRGRRRRVRQLGLHVRRLQALHERRLPRRVPDRRAGPHGVRDRRAPARVCNGCGYCIPSCPFGVVDRVPEDGRAPSARSVTTASRTGSSPRARRRARPTRSSSAPTTSSSRSPRGASRRCTRVASRAPTSTAPATSRRSARRWARRVLPADREARALRAAGAGRLADPGERRARHDGRHGRGLLAAAGVAAASCGRRRGERRARWIGSRRRHARLARVRREDRREGRARTSASGGTAGGPTSTGEERATRGRRPTSRTSGRRRRRRARASCRRSSRGRSSTRRCGRGRSALLLVRRHRGGLVVRGARL